MSYIPEPVTRADKYLAYIAGDMDVALPDHPITRKEHYLAAWAEKSGFEDVDVAGEPPLTLENAIGKPLKGLMLYGKSTQKTTTGAQLFPPPSLGSQEKNGITIDCMEDGKIRISGIAETNTDFYLSRLQLPAGTYTFSAGVNIDASVLRYTLVTQNGVLYFDVHGDHVTDTIKEPIEVSLLLRIYTGKSIDLTVQPMLNIGSTPLPWEPYTGGLPSPSPDYPQEIESVGQGGIIGVEVRGENPNSAYGPQSMNISTPNGLPGIPVSSGGNYTDEKGQQWVCNTIEFRNSVAEMVQRIECIDFKAARWQIAKRLNAVGGFFFISQIKKSALYGTTVMGTTSNILRIGNPYTDFGDYVWALTNNGRSECRIGFTDSTIDSTEKLTNLLNSLPEAYAMYCIAEPIRTPLSPETIAAYKQLHTYKGTTIINNDAGAYMSVKYEKMK